MNCTLKEIDKYLVWLIKKRYTSQSDIRNPLYEGDFLDSVKINSFGEKMSQ